MSTHTFMVKPKLINSNATASTMNLMKYLCSIYGKKVLTGQQIGVVTQPEMAVISEITGTYPAVYGFDMMNYSPSRIERGSTCRDVDDAILWWDEGGIVTFCWHWNAPDGLVDIPPEKSWDRGFYTEATTFNIEEALEDDSNHYYQLIIRDMDAIAAQLKRLQAAEVPVLWRPLHEASGGWFWWGAHGPEPCIKLWKLMVERFTHIHGLNNLIWVWNGQHKDWYPGDEYVDIIGEDIYAPSHDYSAQWDRFKQAEQCTTTPKLIALSENGVLPSLHEMEQRGAMWLWQCTWYGEFVCRAVDLYADNEEKAVVEHYGQYYTYCEDYTEMRAIIDFYRDDRSITRDQLPHLKLSFEGE